MFTGVPRASASGAPRGAAGGSMPDEPGSASLPSTGVSPRATARVIYANATQASWEAVTDGGVLVAGATPIAPGDVRFGNLHIIDDAIKAIAAAGGPVLTRGQVALFGGQT